MNRTDWELYYSSPMPTAFFARAAVRFHLLRMIRKTNLNQNSSIAELGGGGSCFCNAIRKHFKIKDYTAFDSCSAGLEKLLERCPGCNTVQTDLLQWTPDKKYDLVFSVGLIEHFSREQTAELIRKHFDMTEKGGFVVIFFPTPTFLYRITRKTAEFCGLWKFPDERPLTKEEVRETADSCGTFLNGFTVNMNLLSQYAALYRK